MNAKQIFNHIKYSVIGGGTSFAQDIRWQSRKEIVAAKRRKQDQIFQQRKQP